MTAGQAALVAALITILPSVATGVITYVKKPKNMDDAALQRIQAALATRAGWTKHVYPKSGFGLIAPSSWLADDAAARFAGGDADLIMRYEPTKAAIGVKFRMRSVQRTYINDPAAEVTNQLDVLRKLDANARVSEITIAGRGGKLYEYQQATGKRFGDIRMYSVRIIPEVLLEVRCFTYVDAPDRTEFWNTVDDMLRSVTVDELGLPERRLKTIGHV